MNLMFASGKLSQSAGNEIKGCHSVFKVLSKGTYIIIISVSKLYFRLVLPPDGVSDPGFTKG
jgi:hypothetical protein